MNQGNRKAAWVLVLLAPLIAELGLGVTPASMAYLILLWLPIYGAGILFLREIVRRSGRGWLSVILLGFAYELIEDGIGLQALSSPKLYSAAEWGPRVFGLNLPYWEANALYHIIFSAIIPILLTDMLFPSHRDTPYLKKGGLVITGVIAVLGVGILRIAVPPAMDPGYMAPISVLVGVVIGVALLAFLALKVVPPRQPPPVTANAAPGLFPLWLAGGVGTALLLFLLFPLGSVGAKHAAFTSAGSAWLPMIGALLVAGAAYFIVRHWANATGWTDRHALALAGGAIVSHSILGVLIFGATMSLFDKAGLAVYVVVAIILVALFDRKLRLSEVSAA